MDIAELTDVLESYGIRPSRARGQSFLIDESVVERQIAHADIREHDRILEIGPGTGVLTRALSAAAPGGEIIAIEQDSRLVEYLGDHLHEWGIRNVTLVHGDALKVNLPPVDRIVANLPYKISSSITFRFLDLGFGKAVCLYQKEFAQRLIAPQGTHDYGRLSIKMHYRGHCEILETVPPSAFHPRPRVDSALVSIVPAQPPFVVRSEETFFALLDAVFQHRRKTIGNALKLGWTRFDLPKSKMAQIAASLQLPAKRPEEFLPEELGAISDELHALLPRTEKDTDAPNGSES